MDTILGHFDKHGSFETLTKFASRMFLPEICGRSTRLTINKAYPFKPVRRHHAGKGG
jgi:hypothetical protein